MGLRDVWIAGKILLLGVLVRVCQEGISAWTCRLSKALPHQCSGIIQSAEGLERIKRQGKGELALLAWAEISILWALALLVLRPLGSERNLHHWLPWFLSLNLDGLKQLVSWVFSLQMAEHGASQSPQLREPISITNLLLYLSTYVLLVLFLWRTLTSHSSSGSGVMHALLEAWIHSIPHLPHLENGITVVTTTVLGWFWWLNEEMYGNLPVLHTWWLPNKHQLL